jgi:hypothetical protein
VSGCRLHTLRAAFALSWLALSSVAYGQAAPASPTEQKPDPVRTAASEIRSEIKAEAKAIDKKPQVRTYSSVTVVSDPAQVPRLPLPRRPVAEPRESARALREEIQEMRRSLRQDRPGAADASGAAMARPDATRVQGTPSTQQTAADPGAGSGARQGLRPRGPAGDEPGAKDGRDAPDSQVGRRERERRDPDVRRQRSAQDGDRPRPTGDSERPRPLP